MTDEENAKLVELLRKKREDWCNIYEEYDGKMCCYIGKYGKVRCPSNIADNCAVEELVRAVNKEIEKKERLNMSKYVKKPVVIEAYQTDKEMIIHTLEGDMKASVGDYIITGVHGEQYPCKPDIFEETYKPVEDESEGGTHEHVWPRKIVH